MAQNKAEKPEKPLGKSKIAEREEEILKFWQEKNIFQKTLEKESPRGEFIFYDGPPFATGLPHYGNLLAGTMKDFIGRYQTMKGKHVPRRWGWDCHGLPVENIVEKEIGLKSKKDIEEFGLEKFNDIARSKVFTYVDDWKKIIPRMGRFVDMQNDYRTMNPSFTESVWWVFKELQKKGLVYEGFKSMHWCPHCGTTLSNFEVSQGYKDITDISVIGKFELAEEPGTYFLAWTTTPWTLPGNVALAVNPDIDYVKIKILEPESKDIYILAEARLSQIKGKYELLERIKGDELTGISYKPLFNYYDGAELKNRENGWKVYPAGFVTTEDGTGIVHIAPAFGEDDLNLGNADKLPFIQHVDTAGKFKKEIRDFAGLPVKPRENPQAADIEIIKYLAGKNLIFAKEKFTHSYPHCYRCETPLLNYATSSWFVEVTKIRKDLVEANKKVSWVPKEIGENRFGDWLENARDWAISRERFWGAPIPVWKCSAEGCNEKAFIGSLQELKERTKSKNTFYVVRHGEAESNVKNVLSSDPKEANHLTELGKAEALAAAKNIDGRHIDVIYASPFMRTRETAEIIAEQIGYPKDKIVYDDRLHEIAAGVLDKKPDAEYQAFFESRDAKFWKKPEGGENYTMVKNRMTQFLYDRDAENEGKHILIVSHNTPIYLMFAGAAGANEKEAIAMRTPGTVFIKNSEIKELDFAPIPHNRNFELDFHRPFIDEIHLKCSCGGVMKRIPEVFDCWFESGSMPFGQAHYPFEKGNFDPERDKGFPADFIAEGLDQTRGWFYTMLIVSTALFGESSYKNVVVNGIVLAENGQKMSKHLKNYSDPMELVSKYGADAMRYYLLSSPVVKAEDLKFSDRGVDEVLKKIVMRLQNVYSFFEMYGGFDAGERKGFVPKNVLDRWILARLAETAEAATKATDRYEIDRAVRPLADLVDDLSVWYLRRSRERFKSADGEDRSAAMLTTKVVLLEMSKLLAPSMPFLAEDLYLKITGGLAEESVHLEAWPDDLAHALSDGEALIENMAETRRLASLGLEARAKAGIKVRQPLRKLSVKSRKLEADAAFLDLVKDEVNVKEIGFDPSLSAEAELDIEITPELKEEGNVREIVRAVQELRKARGLEPADAAELVADAGDAAKALLRKYEREISKLAGLSKITFAAALGEAASAVEGLSLKLDIK